MINRLRAEVLDMHRWLEGWLRGDMLNTDDNFARFADAMAVDFTLISPRGVLDDKGTIESSLRQGHGRSTPDFGIEIRNVHHRFSHGGLHLVTYEEWQSGPETTGRLSTALFRQATGAPLGLHWVHLHETWLS